MKINVLSVGNKQGEHQEETHSMQQIDRGEQVVDLNVLPQWKKLLLFLLDVYEIMEFGE